MGRPVSVSDEQILSAAQRVLDRRGPAGFSMSEVATEVGLSRASIIGRFSGAQSLKVRLLSEYVDQFEVSLRALPKTPGGDGLLHVAAFMGSNVGSREGSAKYIANYASSVRDRALLTLENRRGEALNQAIAAVMPKVAIRHDAAVLAFRTHLTGCIVSWIGMNDADPRRYLVLRTEEWLELAGISFTTRLVEELAGRAQGKAERSTVARSSAPRRTKVTRGRS